MINVENLKPFPKFCYTIGMIPKSYKESLTYEEQLMWLCDFLENTVIPTVNNNGMAVQELQNLFVELKNYVDNYFTNLDVQEEINNKLDKMVQDGTLSEIITAYLQVYGVLAFNTVADLKLATNLIEGSFVKTLGYYSKGDAGATFYKIRNKTNEDITNDMNLIAIGDTLIAEMIYSLSMNPKQFGAVGDGLTDDTLAIQTCINSVSNIDFLNETYLITVGDILNPINFYYALSIPSNKIVNLNKATIKLNAVNGSLKEKYCAIYINNSSNVTLKNGTIIGDKLTHIGTMSEYGHGIAIFRAENCLIDNVCIYNNIGDGITIQSEFTSSQTNIISSNNIRILNSEIHDCRRNGISNIGGNNVIIDNCYIYSISGTSPQACIDIEGNLNERQEYPHNTQITNCKLLNSTYRGLLIYERSYDNYIFNCQLSNLTLYGKASILSCNIKDLYNYSDEEVTINNSIIYELHTVGYLINVKNCDITYRVNLIATSSREDCIIKFINSILHSIYNGSTSPNYKLYFDNCNLDFGENIIEVPSASEVYFNNCNIKTKSRIIAGGFNHFEAKNSIFDINSNVSSALIYNNSLTSAVLLNNTIKGSHAITSVFNGTLFNATTLASLLFIGNICHEIGTLSSGTITNKISALNYQTSLNA